MPVCGDVERRRQHSTTTAIRYLPECEWPALDMPWAIASTNAAFSVCSRCGGAVWLGRWFVGGAVLLNAGVFQIWRRCLTTTAHRALPVCEWPALGMPWGTARSNAVSAVCSRRGGACTWGCGRAGQVVCGGCGFAGVANDGHLAKGGQNKTIVPDSNLC